MNENHDPSKLGPGWEHLFVKDSRSEEERKAAEARESGRRRGRKTKGWHLKYLDENGRLKD